MMKRNSLLLFVLLLFTFCEVKAQVPTCDPSVPFYQVNLSGNPAGTWTSPGHARQGNCCGTQSPDRCTSFEVILDTGAAMVNFQIASGAIPPGSMFYQINCGPQIPVGSPICVQSNNGPIHITFCKPGNNQNTYLITSIPKPTFPRNDTVRIGCNQNIFTLGLDTNSVTWTSVFPGPQGAYNSYLSCTSNCTNPVYTPAPNAPPYVEYRICGHPMAAQCGYVDVCDTVRIYNFPSLSGTASPNPGTFCANGPGVLLTASGIGGDGNYSYIWRDQNGNIVSTSATYQAAAAGTYTAEIRDGLYNTSQCPPFFISVPVTVVPPPVVNAGPDQVLCPGSPTAYLNGTVQNATGGVWTNGGGSFSPNATSLITSYTPTASEVASGVVTLILTSTGAGGGCANSTDTLKIYYPPQLTISLPSQALLCHANTTTLSPVVNGGIGPYQYTWSNGSTTSSITVGQGTYCVTITDNIGCTISACATISVPPVLTLTLGETDVTTNGGNNGTASANPGGGTFPYSYSWSNGQTTSTATGLSYGIYSVIITDANGCTISSSVVVNEPRCLSLQANATTGNISCYGNNSGVANVSVTGGTSPYTYSWAPSAQTASSVSGLGAGSYLVFVTDATGCTDISSAVILQPAQLVNNMTHTNATTIGGNNGTATANPAGGIPAYSYSWSTGATTQNITGLFAGSYTVTITDNNGCTITDVVLITEPPCNNLVLGVFTNNVSCNGGGNGTASAFTVFGFSPYTYSWSTGQTTANVSGLSAGTYTVTVNDAINCSQLQTVTITQPSPLSLALSPTNISCSGNNDGTIDLTVSGGTFPYTFSWSNNVNVEDQYYLSDGTYSVIVTDANNCTMTASTVITRPTVLSAVFTKTDVTCNAGSNGSIDVTVSGGVLPYGYSWSNGATTQDLNGITAGQYFLSVTDANGCVLPTQLSVLVDEPLPVSVASVAVNCPVPGSGTSTITVVPSGGNNGPYQVSYDNGNTYDPAGIYTESLAADSVYYIMVMDGNGCVSPLRDTLNINPEVTVTSASFSRCFTNGTSVTPVTVVPAGGDGGPYIVSFDNGVTYGAQGNYSQNLPIANSYSIIVRDLTGCASDTFNITIPDTMSNSVVLSQFSGNNNISCFGNADGSIDLSVNGGTQPYTYAWSNSSASQDISNLTAGNYSVVITDVNGCRDTASVTLVQPALLTASSVVNSNFNGYSVSCNSSSNGSVDLTVNGGTAGYTYVWNNSSTTEDLSNITAGTYSVTITDANGCTVTSSITLTEPAVIALSTVVQDVPCNGFATGVIDLTVSGGVPVYNYVWSNSSTTEDISGLMAGTYSVTVTDLNGCTQVISATVNQQSPIVLNAGATDPSCYGDLNGGISLIVNGGTPAYNFSWSNGSTSQMQTGLGVGTYSVVVTDANLCTATQTWVLGQPDSLFAFAVSPATYSGHNVSLHGANDGSIDLTITGGTLPYTYSWSNGATTQDLGGIPAGNYSVIVTDAKGCSYVLSIALTEPLALEMPSGFSPNSDGVNDYFVVHGIEAYPNNKLVVFNRWGNEVFSQDSYTNKWDGRNNGGEQLPDGTYFVILNVNNGDIILKGYVDLRK